ncbi:MAG: STT3 domain-containing protein [Nanoarchaeota archaeon]|nr:STT3 domain-containing protein [Nanoarchaeota archaeon]
MEQNIVEQRKESLRLFYQKYKSWLIYAALIAVIILGMWMRSQNLELLKDETTGQYISAELDSTVFLRYAEYIVEHGSLPAVDSMRFVPVGADLSVIGTFTSYFVAYLYKFLHFFDADVTVQYADIVYPIIAMALMTLFMFLLVRRILDDKSALLASLFVTVIPTFLFRTTGGSSDHDALGMLLLMMIMYLYVVAYQSKTLRNTLIFGGLSAIALVVGRHTAGTVNFSLFVLGGFTLLAIVMNRFEKRHFYLYSFWLVLSMVVIQFSGKFGGVIAFATSVTTGIAFIALLFAVVDFFLFKLDVFKIRSKIDAKMPLWLATLGFSLVLGVIIISVMFGPGYLVVKAQHIGQYLFHAYGETRWTLTVAENRQPYVADWLSQMFPSFVYFFMFGGIWLFYRMVEKLQHAKGLTIFFSVFLFGYVFSRYSSNSVFNGDSAISHWVFYGSLIVFFAVIAVVYIRSFYKDRSLYESIGKQMNFTYALLFVWFLVMIMAATSAIRLLSEFSVITSILAAFFVVSALRFFYQLKLPVLRYGGIVVLLIILVSPFSVGFIQKGLIIRQFESSSYQAAHTGPAYDRQWQLGGQWVRENTPKDAVFMHWWDYGYWVQSGFQRASVTDGGNFFVYWNYLTGRHLLTGDNVTTAFELMKSHNVTHVLMVSDEIGKYGAYSSIGSDLNFDRFASIGIFSFDQQKTQETRNNTIFFYQGGVQLYETFIRDGVVFPPSTPVAGFLVYVHDLNVSQSGLTLKVDRVEAIMFKDGKQYQVPLSCVYFDKEYELFAQDAMPGCLRIIPQIVNNQLFPLGNAIFVPPKIKNNLFGQLYLLNRQIPGFNLSYSDDSIAPLGVYGGRLYGPMRIWEIAYPKDIKVNPEFLLLDYPDQRLKLPPGQ